MWFKNLQIYCLASDWRITLQQLEEQLQRYAFQPCGSMDIQSRGWVPPRSGDDRLAYAQYGQILLALRVEHKILPGSVIDAVAKDRAVEFEQQQGYIPGRKQMREIKERAAEELIPKAFATGSTTYVWIDTQHGWLIIDTSSTARADEVLEMLHKCIADLPVSMLRTVCPPSLAMETWLVTNEAPSGFSIDRDCELCSPVEEKSTVRYIRQSLDSAEIGKHIVEGKHPTRLALTWDNRISFVLTDKLEIKRLAFLDILKEEAESNAETADEQFDADFTLMTGELVRLLSAVVAALGGEKEEK